MAKHPFGVLIIHGFTASLDCVSDLEPPIAALGLPTRVPVLRGHGAASPDALRSVTWQDWVADGETALQDLLAHAERAIIVGHSMGTLVTISLAAAHAGDGFIDSIALAAPAVYIPSPLAPGHSLAFLRPLVTRVLRKYDMPPNYADKSLEVGDTNYPWAPMSSVSEFLEFTQVARSRLPEVNVPLLVLQSRNDSTVDPRSAEIVLAETATAPVDKRIVWFEETEHEMFRDCERAAVVAAVVDFVKGRVRDTVIGRGEKGQGNSVLSVVG
jgi:carboxylesterase